MKKGKPKRSKIGFWIYLFVCLFLANGAYHIWKNPIHVLSFFSSPFRKTPQQTWESYGRIFEDQANEKVSGPLLAAIAQAESGGNPLAAPGWSFEPSTDVVELFAPASTAFGLMQITKGTFDLMLRSCDGDCPQRELASRVRPTDSVRLTSSFLRKTIATMVNETEWQRLTSEKATRLAAVIHLCGPEVGKRLIRERFRTERLPRCGAHWPDVYVRKVLDYRKVFERLASNDGASRF